MKNKLHKVYPTKISSKQEMKEAIKDFSGNLCKATALLKNDKEIVKEAVKDNPMVYRFAGTQIKEDVEIKELASKSNYARKVLVYPSELEDLSFLQQRNIDYYKELNSGSSITDLETEYDNLLNQKQIER